MRFSSTPRGARLARRLAAQWLDEHGLPYGTDAHDDVVLIAAELAANAVRHGRVAGRDFRLRMSVGEGTVRVEATDARGERAPAAAPEDREERGDAESGRGLLLVERLAARWGWEARRDGPGKTVWAEYDPAP
ncbi:anti-sigma regulatory factor [Streptomyces sp. DH37]|uniref:ATP-binding protein n=1 Tax=Streptomyces sp. DH37 TaxID=3040122 RepID=UPI0024426E17|nr:ATP-binding protein [Streptomyces sp. DH37]MDG9705429.1 ATP-binding protein [Streptomyces sp. DH37]